MARQLHGSGQPIQVVGRVKASIGLGSLSTTQTKPLPHMRVQGYKGTRVFVETDKGDVPIWNKYFQLWYMQGTPYALYDNYAYVTL